MIKILPLLLLAATLYGESVVIDGRLESLLYRIDIPKGWLSVLQEKSDDTRLPIALFTQGTMKIEIHNFPSMEIAPMSQIDRWKKRIDEAAFYTISPQSFAGFRGYKIESKGMIAFALEIPYPVEGEKKSPVTLKITGDAGEIIAYHKELLSLCRSFELRDPL